MSDKVYILGPCSMENDLIFYKSLEHLNNVCKGREWYFKCSFDKANRTSLHGGRGPGLKNAIALWEEARQEYPNVKFITDVHEVDQVWQLDGVVDAIQIPAFLCRQTDLIVECAKYFDVINIKKMQHLGPNNLIKSVDKIKETNPDCQAWICDRGSNFGYDHLIMDFTYIEELKKHYDKVIIDATHATQRSRAVHGTQGDRELAKKYFMSAPIFGYDGVFAETHPNPSCAVSDGDCQLELTDIQELLEKSDLIGNIINK